MAEAAGRSLIEHFSALRDPRQAWKVVCPLPEILLLLLCATLAGAGDFVEVEAWGRERVAFLRRFLPYKDGVPSHDTLNEVVNALDAELFKACLTARVESLRAGLPPLRADGGPSELVAVEVERCFRGAPARDLDRAETMDGDHGRIEVRRHAVSRDVGWLSAGHRFPSEPRCPGRAAVGMVEAEVERGGETSRERRHVPSSVALDATLLVRAMRSHWHVGNRLHWVRDVVFRDDLSRLRTGRGPQTMAVLRDMAVNLARRARDRHSLKVRRKEAGWSGDCLEALLRQTA